MFCLKSDSPLVHLKCSKVSRDDITDLNIVRLRLFWSFLTLLETKQKESFFWIGNGVLERKLKSFHFLRVVWIVRVNQWRNGPMNENHLKITKVESKLHLIIVTGSNLYRLLKALATLFGKFYCVF